MFNKLQYVSGAVPGRPIKRPNTITDKERKTKQKKYEKEVRERQFQESWKIGRDWLVYCDQSKQMSCKVCKQHFSQPGNSGHLKIDKWTEGVESLKKDNIIKHESSKGHCKAVSCQPKPYLVQSSAAADTLRKLKNIDKEQMSHKFRNAHAIAKWHASFKMYVKLCQLDHAKGLNVSTTYETDKSCKQFLGYIAQETREGIFKAASEANYISITVDGCTDSSGIEQESVYVHFCRRGVVKQHFVCYTSPQSTSAENIYSGVMNSLDCYVPGSREKLVGLTCDGASNMMGVRKGVAALLKQENPEIVATHCLAHRLELGVRDAFKKQPLYDKTMTLLVGLYYFYKKSSKQQKELAKTFDVLKEKSLTPTRSGGTRWVPHIVKSSSVLCRGYNGFMTHLANSSHSNAKAEGLYKLASNINVMLFIIMLKEILAPVERLSLLLQREDTNLGEVLMMKSAALECLEQLKTRKDHLLADILTSGKYKGFALKSKGNPINVDQLRISLIESVSKEVTMRFSVDDFLLEATQIVNFKIWPDSQNRQEIHGFGVDYIETLVEGFPSKLNQEVLDVEWGLLKNLIYKRYSSEIQTLKWSVVSKAMGGLGVDHVLDLIDLILSLPPTSVFNERSFSQMKLMKTDRRSRMKSDTMTDVMLVKLETDDVDKFDPLPSIDRWATSSKRQRRPQFIRKKAQGQKSEEAEIENPQPEPPIESPCQDQADEADIDTDTLDSDSDYESDFDSDEEFVENQNKILQYAKTT